MMKSLLAGLAAWVMLAGAAVAVPPDVAQKIYDKATPSLVAVQYTLDGEFGRREFVAQAVVVGEEGIVMTSMAIFPIQIPDEQMKEFKIIVPGDEEKELDAIFLGRDERSEMAFLKTKVPQKWAAVKFEEAPPKIAEQVISIGLLPKEAGYKAYYAEAMVSASVRGPMPYVLVTPGGLTTVGSPVFDADGKAIGIVPFQQAQNFLLNGANIVAALASPPRFFVPARDFLPSLADLPNGEPIKLPWLGAPLQGLNKEVAEYYKLKNVPVAQIGEVIPNSPAAKAGLKAGDKIIKLNGEALDRGDEPDETSRILLRKIKRMKVGDKITLTVMREREKQGAAAGAPKEREKYNTDIPVLLEQQPKQMNLAKRFYAEDLGMSVREIVFTDTYAEKLPADTKGVIVAYVKPASSAASAGLKVGDVVTQLNKLPANDLDSFKTQYADFRQKSPKDVVVLMATRKQKTEVIKIEPPQ